MRRRELFVLLGGAVAWPLAVRAQQPNKIPKIGFLSAEALDVFTPRLRAFLEGLSEMGQVEGRDFSIEYRWADGRNDQLPALAADLANRPVAVIVTVGSTPAALAAKNATTTIPVVFFIGGDPLKLGLVANLTRPEGNLTGVTSLNVEVGPKRMEILHQVVPTARSMTLLVNPTSPELSKITTDDAQAAAHILDLKINVLHASTDRELDTVFATVAQVRPTALVVAPDAFFIGRGEHLGTLALRHGVPTAFQYRPFVAAGGLMSYGGSIREPYRLAGVSTGRILKGDKPADLPVHQATKVELIINLKTAKTLGLTVPPSLLARADELIE